MVSFEFDAELYREALIEQGREEGLAKGHEEERTSLVESLMRVGTPVEYIIAATGWTEEKILSLTEK